MKKYIATALLSLTASLSQAGGNEFCGAKNTAFSGNEAITIKVFYNLGKMYVGAGEATFTTSIENINNKVCYHIVGDGKTYKSYDWFFKVRDKYETYIDTTTLLPQKFIRNVNEGGYRIINNVTFNQTIKTAVSTNGVFQVPDCIQDVLSSIYYARNINFAKYNVGDKIPFNMFLDDEVFNVYIRYLGKEKITTRFGTFNAIKFKPLLIKGTIFEGGEKMIVYVSDDANKIPLRVESPIAVGQIKCDLVGYSNLRWPLTSLIELRK
jgi:hypothetical protein